MKQNRINRINKLNKTPKIQNEIERENRTNPSYIFIHIPKNMGSFVHRQLPQHYNRYFYGLKPFIYHKSSYDHFTLQTSIDIGLVNITNMKILPLIFSIVREPIERFVSICNFHSLSPTQAIQFIKRMNPYCKIPNTENKQNHFIQQYRYIVTNDISLKIQLFRFDDTLGIGDYLKTLLKNNHINMNKKINVSKKKYNVKDIDKSQIEFLQNYYKEDIRLYNSIPIGGLVVMSDKILKI